METRFSINGSKKPLQIDESSLSVNGFLRAVVENRFEVEGMRVSETVMEVYSRFSLAELIWLHTCRGYVVTTAANGRLGVRIFSSQPFDVVITDVIMPEMEGIETIINLKKNTPSVKIIAMSGGSINSSTEYLDIARQLGAAKTFDRPLQRSILLVAVAELSS